MFFCLLGSQDILAGHLVSKQEVHTTRQILSCVLSLPRNVGVDVGSNGDLLTS